MEPPEVKPDSDILQKMIAFLLEELYRVKRDYDLVKIEYGDLKMLYEAQVDLTELKVEEIDELKHQLERSI